MMETDCPFLESQRWRQAAGTYGYMFREKGKREYVDCLPAVFERTGIILERYPALAGLQELLVRYTNKIFAE